MMAPPLLAPGLFGKMMSQGDFVTRRTPANLTMQWDQWLQMGLFYAQQQLAGAWLNIYMESPIWHFALAPGVCGNAAWAGVLMPSIDSVGRQFPLSLFYRLPLGVGLWQCVHEEGEWFEQLEELALSSLDPSYTVEHLDQDLQAMPAMLTDPSQRLVAAASLPQSRSEKMVLAAGGAAPYLALQTEHDVHGQSMWWSEGSARLEPALLHCAGLPQAAGFCSMLTGDWGAGGWQEQALVTAPRRA